MVQYCLWRRRRDSLYI